jgi:hypothetical protein
LHCTGLALDWLWQDWRSHSDAGMQDENGEACTKLSEAERLNLHENAGCENGAERKAQ